MQGQWMHSAVDVLTANAFIECAWCTSAA
jgi:hypothetical protein